MHATVPRPTRGACQSNTKLRHNAHYVNDSYACFILLHASITQQGERLQRRRPRGAQRQAAAASLRALPPGRRCPKLQAPHSRAAAYPRSGRWAQQHDYHALPPPHTRTCSIDGCQRCQPGGLQRPLHRGPVHAAHQRGQQGAAGHREQPQVQGVCECTGSGGSTHKAILRHSRLAQIPHTHLTAGSERLPGALEEAAAPARLRALSAATAQPGARGRVKVKGFGRVGGKAVINAGSAVQRIQLGGRGEALLPLTYTPIPTPVPPPTPPTPSAPPTAHPAIPCPPPPAHTCHATLPHT